MKRRCVGLAPMIGLLALGWSAPAGGVIRVDLPVSRIYSTARAVVVAAVVRVTAENRVIDVRVSGTLKGEALPERLRIQIVSPAELIRQVAVGSPAVFFLGKAGGGAVGVLHVADSWLVARRISPANPGAWRVVQRHDAARKSFPGRTAALVRIVAALKAGKRPLLDKIEQNVFRGGAAKLADVMKNARFLLAPDLNGDGRAEVLVGNAGGVQLWEKRGTPAAEERRGDPKLSEAAARWHLDAAKGLWAASGDANADGKCDLLVGTTLWLNAGSRFRACPAKLALPDNPLAVALADATGDGKADVVALGPDGSLRVLANPGAPTGSWKPAPARTLWRRGPQPVSAALSTHWGDTGGLYALVVTAKGITRYGLDEGAGPPADHLRLTGQAMIRRDKKDPAGWGVLAASPLDINGDGRLDFLVAAAEGGEVLVNRGYGTFLVNPEGPAALRSGKGRQVPWGPLTPDMLLAPADLHGDKFDDLLILPKDGRLFELSNPPFAPPP